MVSWQRQGSSFINNVAKLHGILRKLDEHVQIFSDGVRGANKIDMSAFLSELEALKNMMGAISLGNETMSRVSKLMDELQENCTSIVIEERVRMTRQESDAILRGQHDKDLSIVKREMVEQLRLQLELMDEFVNVLQEIAQKIKTELDGLRNQLANIDGQIEEISKKIEQIEQKITKAGQKLEKLVDNFFKQFDDVFEDAGRSSLSNERKRQLKLAIYDAASLKKAGSYNNAKKAVKKLISAYLKEEHKRLGKAGSEIVEIKQEILLKNAEIFVARLIGEIGEVERLKLERVRLREEKDRLVNERAVLKAKIKEQEARLAVIKKQPVDKANVEMAVKLMSEQGVTFLPKMLQDSEMTTDQTPVLK